MKKRNRFFGLLVGVFVFLSVFLAMDAGATLVSVKVAWCPHTDPSVTGYKLRHGTAHGVYGEPIDVGNVVLVDLADLGIEFEEGTNQYLVVTAYDSRGYESAFSQELVFNVVEGDGQHFNWVKVRGSELIDGFDATYPANFCTSTSATSASQNKVNLTGLDLRNTEMYIEVLAAGAGTYLPYISVVLSVLLPTSNTTVNATLQYKYIESDSHTATTATFHLGAALNDGQWHSIRRDFIADLISADFDLSCSVVGFVSANVYSYKNTSRSPLFETLRIKKIVFASSVGTSSCP